MRIPLFGQATEGRSKQVTSQARVNCVIEQSGDKGEMTAYQRNGTELFATLPAGVNPIAMGNWVSYFDSGNYKNLLLVIGSKPINPEFSEGKIYTLSEDGTVTAEIAFADAVPNFPIGKIAFGDQQFSFSSKSYGGGFLTYYWDTLEPFTGPLAQNIIDGTTDNVIAASIAYLDQRFYALTNNTGQNLIRWSPLGGFAGTHGSGVNRWSALAFLKHGFGFGFGCFTYGDGLVCFFSKGIVFYQTTTDPNNPIQRVGSLLNDYRLESVNSVATSGDYLCFIGSQSNRRGVYVLRGYSVEKISTPDVEEKLATFSGDEGGINTVSGSFANFRGHDCYLLMSSFFSIYYDFSSGLWAVIPKLSEASYPFGFGSIYRTLANKSISLIAKPTDNKIYKISDTVYTDLGRAIVFTFRSPAIYDEINGDRLSCSRVRIDVDYIAKGSVQPLLLVSRDGGKTWGNPISCDPPGYNVDGTLINRLEFRRIGGRARDWRFLLYYEGENPITVVDAFAEFEK